MRSWKRIRVAVLVATAACAHGTKVESGTPSTPTGTYVSPLSDGRLPAGTVLWVQLPSEIDEDQRAGDPFSSILVQPIADRHGDVLVPEGTPVHGRIVELRGGSASEPAAVRLAVESMDLQGESVPLEAHVVETKVPEKGHRQAKGAVAGGAAGAILGGIIGGGKGALIGGLAGVAGGTLIAAGTGRDPELPAGTQLAVQIDRPVASLASIRKHHAY